MADRTSQWICPWSLGIATVRAWSATCQILTTTTNISATGTLAVNSTLNELQILLIMDFKQIHNWKLHYCQYLRQSRNGFDIVTEDFGLLHWRLYFQNRKQKAVVNYEIEWFGLNYLIEWSMVRIKRYCRWSIIWVDRTVLALVWTIW